MDFDIYYDFIQPIDLNNEFAIYETYSARQLAIRVKLLNNMKDDYKIHIKKYTINQKFLTTEQTKIKEKFIKFLDEHYPVLDVSENKKETNYIIRKRETSKFYNTCHSNNIIMMDNEFLKKLITLIEGKGFNKKEYDNEKIVCDCGCVSYRKNLSTHKKSKLHEKRLAEVNKLMEEEMA